MNKSIDKNMPLITGSVGFVIANTFVSLAAYKPQKYPMDWIRVNLLVYETNRRMRKTHGNICFHEPFVVMEIDDKLIPILPSLAALYAGEEPCLIANAAGAAVVVHLNDPNRTGNIIGSLYYETRNMSNDKLLEFLKHDNITLNNLIRGRVISI